MFQGLGLRTCKLRSFGQDALQVQHSRSCVDFEIVRPLLVIIGITVTIMIIIIVIVMARLITVVVVVVVGGHCQEDQQLHR